MAAITATHNQDLQSPGFDIALTGLDSTGSWTHFRVVRRDLSGVLPDAVVRGLDLQPQTAATAAGSDYEAPFSYHNYQYRLEMWTSGVLSTTVTYNLPAPGYFFPATTAMTTSSLQDMATAYLKSVNTPSLSRAVVIADFKAYSRQGRILSSSSVLGRKNPVNTMDVMGGRKGSFAFLVGNLPGATSLATQTEYEALLDEGDVYLFQSVLYKSSGIKDLFMNIEDVSWERASPQTLGIHGNLGTVTTYLTDADWLAPIWQCTVNWVETDRPPTGDVGVTSTTWQDVLNAYATWQAVLDGNATWLEVLQGTHYPH